MSKTMRAILSHSYSTPANITYSTTEPVPDPPAGYLRLRTQAAALNALDWRLCTASPWLVRLGQGLFSPSKKQMGADVSGIVDAIGEGVTGWKVGDAVFGDIQPDPKFGSFAEYTCCAADGPIAKIPEGVSFEDAAAVPIAAGTALQGLREVAKVQAGEHVLVHGAGGGVGSFAVQIAKSMGATVTAVTSSAKVDAMKELGADKVIDYTKDDFVKAGDKYDVIFDAGAYRGYYEYKSVMHDKSRYVLAGGLVWNIVSFNVRAAIKGDNFKSFMCESTPASMNDLSKLLHDGTIKPFITQRISLDEVPGALTALQAGQTQGGKIVVTMAKDQSD